MTFSHDGPPQRALPSSPTCPGVQRAMAAPVRTFRTAAKLSKACKPDLRTRPVQRLLVATRVRQPSKRRRAVRRPDTPEAAMFEEAQLYAPVTRSPEGDVT